MNQYVAVACESALPGIKRHLVLFDRVAVLQSHQDWSFRADDPSLAADLDWLEDKGLVFRVSDFLNQECGFELDGSRKNKEPTLKLVDIPKREIKRAREARLGRKFIQKFNAKTVKDVLQGLEDWGCRWEAQRLAASTGVQAVSLSSPRTEVNELLGADTRTGDVLRVLLNGMPEPSDTTSLDQVLQFRQDPETSDKMFAFRRWIRTMMTKGSRGHEIAEELDWLVRQYEEHMRFHEMKVNRGIVELTVTTVAEIAEDLIKIRWGKLSKLPFSLTHRKIELMEAEMNAPGREIAYVAQARKAFGRRDAT